MAETTAPGVDALLSHRRWVGRLLRVPVNTGTASGVLSIAIQLGACLAASWVLGGTDGFAPYWYYFPIVFAGLRFGVLGALVTAVTAGLLAGPLTASVVGASPPQAPGIQLAQGAAFVIVGVGLALIVEHTVVLSRCLLSDRELEEQVTGAIERGEVTVEYQPIWTHDRGRDLIVGAEVLVRWVDNALGAVPPGRFVPVLEEAHRLDGLGAWVLDEACRSLAAWQGHRADGDRPFHVAVNVSSVQLDDRFPDVIADALVRHGCDPTGLVLELTERTMLEDSGTAASVLARLRDLGVRIAIDDFGTGYSSLAYLRDLDFDILKLDRAFIDQLGSTRPEGDAIDTAIVGAIITLAGQLGKDVIVEGVESRAQLDRVRALGDVDVQGSLLSPAVPAHVLSGKLSRDHPPESVPETPFRQPRPAEPTESLSTRLRRELTLVATGTETASNNPAQVILAGIFLAGALLTLGVVLFSKGEGEGAKLALGLSALPCAFFLHHFRQNIPEWMLHTLVLAGTLLIVTATATDPVPTTMVASATLLMWVTIYASAFFDLRLAVAHGIIAGAGFGLVLHLRPVEQDAAVWLIIMGTTGVAGFVVGWFARQLRTLAATDPLTGLPNRQAFESMLVTEIDRAERANAPLAVALVDLDDFKTINDTAGHQAGDRVLAGLPSRWRTELRAHDILARYGGDEFVVLLPDCPLDDAEDALARMSRAGIPTCSVGVVTLAWGEDPETLLSRADDALYRAKSQGSVVRADRSVPAEHAVGGTSRRAHPAGAARIG